MIFADKLINLRKKAGMSQEDLAEKLGVSRQSVSKWEGAQSIPDINKIIEMSKLFGVSTDYLLKDEMEELEFIESTDDSTDSLKKVTMEMARNYLAIVEKTRFYMAIGAFLCVISPITLILLSGLTELISFSETLAGAIGLIVLFVLIALGVVLFIFSGLKLNEYEFLEKKIFETEYGVTGLIKEKKKNYQDTYNKLTIGGIVLCILSVIPILILSILDDGKYVTFGVCSLLFIVSLGVLMIIIAGCKMGAYNKLLQEGDYQKEKKNSSPIAETISGAYWLVATAIYLLWSFLSSDWHFTWIVWVIAGVLYPAVMMIVKSFKNDKI